MLPPSLDACFARSFGGQIASSDSSPVLDSAARFVFVDQALNLRELVG
jgi:hypothetical protein